MPKKSFEKPLNLGNETIGQRIARLRKKQGLSQIELAEKIGIGSSIITDYERGKAHLYDDLVARFALALDISTDEILGLKNSTNEKAPSLRFSRRMKDLETLPENKKKIILNILDDFIRANS